MRNRSLWESAARVESREDLARLVEGLRDEVREAGPTWPNCDLSAFLDAIAEWLDEMGRHEAVAQAPPSWRVVGELLVAAAMPLA